MAERDDRSVAQGQRPVSPEAKHQYRDLLTKGEDVIDPKTWAGSFPAAYGIAPRVRLGANRWFNLLWLVPIGFVLLLVAVAVAKELRTMEGIQEFIHRHPGTAFATPFTTALPAWVRVQHFFNLFLMTFIIRAGLQILCFGRQSRTRSRCPSISGYPVSVIRSGSRGGGISAPMCSGSRTA
jgi:hypothetical protein